MLRGTLCTARHGPSNTLRPPQSRYSISLIPTLLCPKVESVLFSNIDDLRLKLQARCEQDGDSADILCNEAISHLTSGKTTVARYFP